MPECQKTVISLFNMFLPDVCSANFLGYRLIADCQNFLVHFSYTLRPEYHLIFIQWRCYRDKLSKDKGQGKPKASRLAPDPKPAPPASEPVSAINVVILFDVADSVCLKRSAGRYGKFSFKELLTTPYYYECSSHCNLQLKSDCKRFAEIHL